MDGGFIIAGSTGSFGSDGDAYVVKTDGNGLPQWTHIYGGVGIQTGVACRVLSDGYIVAGTTSAGDYGSYDMFMTKIDLDGNVIWQRSYGTSAWDICNDVEVTSNGFALVGVSYANNEGDAFVIRTDFNGDTLWTKLFGGTLFDEARGGLVSGDDALIVTGATDLTSENSDAFVTRFDPNGVQDWFRTFGGDSLDYFQSAAETFDGGFACSGGTNSYSNVKQILLVKVDANGDSLWQQEFGSMGDSEGSEIMVNLNGDFAIASYNSYANAGGKDMVLFIASSNGTFLLGKNYGGLGDEVGASLVVLADGGYVVAGTADDYGPGIRSIYVVRTDQYGETSDDTVYEVFDDTGLPENFAPEMVAVTLFPNPATTECHWRSKISLRQIKIVDMQGRLLRSWTGVVPATLDLSGISTGRYMVVTLDDKEGRRVLPLEVQAN
jgi:hypothetical protein